MCVSVCVREHDSLFKYGTVEDSIILRLLVNIETMLMIFKGNLKGVVQPFSPDAPAPSCLKDS